MSRVDARDRLADLAQTPGLLGPDPEPLGELFLGGVAPELDAQGVLRPPQPVQGVHDVGREADGARVVGYGAGNGLADPPRRVGGEAVAHLGVELLDGPDQAGVPLLDEVLEGHAAPAVLLGDRDDEPQVGLDEPPAGLPITLMGAPAEVLLLVGFEQAAASDPAQVLR
jgi:hypothetical protein